jgi:hypothetical protein
MIGSQRYMADRKLAAQAVLANSGGASWFVTMTANPQWREIQACLRTFNGVREPPRQRRSSFNCGMARESQCVG